MDIYKEEVWRQTNGATAGASETASSSCGSSGIYSLSSSLTPSRGTSRGSLSPRALSSSSLNACVTSTPPSSSSLPMILENGRKVYGPPMNFNGAQPPVQCELYVTRMRDDLDEVWLLHWLHRFGMVYKFRLMMNTGRSSRGYGFVRFVEESQALAACELLSFLLIGGERLRVFRSQGKSRLYVSNIPKEVSFPRLGEGFRTAFPAMKNFVAVPPPYGAAAAAMMHEHNRGYAFIEFDNHDDALEAKKRVTPGVVRMWGSDLKVQWAKPPRKISANGKRSDAAAANGLGRNNDYSAKLRLFCLANNWCVPIVLYGQSKRHHMVQYGAVLLRDASTGASCQFLLEVSVRGVYDIHLIISEVVVRLIEMVGCFPTANCVLRVADSLHAELVHTFQRGESFSDVFCHTMPGFVCASALSDLALALQSLSHLSADVLLLQYKKSFLLASNTPMPVLAVGSTQFYAIYPKFRNNPPLNNNFNDTEIVLLLIGTTMPVSENNGRCGGWVPPPPLCHQVLQLKSQRAFWYQKITYRLRYVDALGPARWFYHPDRRINSHPNWIVGHSFQAGLYNDIARR